MASELVLLLTHSGDYYTVDRVLEGLERRGARALRINTDLYPTALKLTAQDLLGFGIIDEIVPEPTGGAHTNPELAATLLDAALERTLAEVSAMPSDARLDARYRKWRAMGNVGFAES